MDCHTSYEVRNDSKLKVERQVIARSVSDEAIHKIKKNVGWTFLPTKTKEGKTLTRIRKARTARQRLLPLSSRGE